MPNRLGETERQRVLQLLSEPEYVDLAIPQIWARELDCGRYLASISTMYRIARAQGLTRERRAQATHPAKVRPELIAHAPLRVWSWDIERHEALLNRAVVKGHRRSAVAAAG